MLLGLSTIFKKIVIYSEHRGKQIKFRYRIQLKLDISFRFPLLLLFFRLSTVYLIEFKIWETIARKFSRFCFKFSKAKIHSPLVSELFSTFEDFVGKPDADGGEYYIMGDFNCNMLPASFYNDNTHASSVKHHR